MAQPRRLMTLASNRAYLVENLDLTGTFILDHLVEADVLSAAKLASIRERYSTNLELTRALLDHLYKRPDADWRKFEECLLQNHHRHVLEQMELQRNAPGSTPKASVTCESLQLLLANVFKAQYDNIKMWRWQEDHAAVHMDDLYVDLVLVKCKAGTCTKEEQHLFDYKDIFKQPRGRGTVYLAGEPGTGKTTFARRICVDWAKSYHETTVTHLKPGGVCEFKNFMFVLPVFLRCVTQGQTLKDLFKQSYRIEMAEAKALCHYIENHQKAILFLIDGLDEYDQGTSEEITQLLHRQWLPHASLLITSRYPASSFFDEEEAPDVFLSLRGYSADGVSKYVNRFFKSNREKGIQLLSKIRLSEDLRHLSRYPGLLLMMSTLWHHKPDFANNVTDLYYHYLQYVCHRYEQKYITGKARTSRQNILTTYHDSLMKIGELATKGMMGDKMQLSFPYSVIDHLGSQTWKLGFLEEEGTIFDGRIVMFPHKSHQEFFVSFYIVHSDERTQKDLLLHFFHSPKAFRESALIRKFLQGMGKKEMHNKINTLIDGNEWEVAEMHTELQMDYLAENEDARLTLPRVMYLKVRNQYPGGHYVKYLKQDGTKLEKLILRTGNERHWGLLQYLQAPHLSCLQLDSWSLSSQLAVEDEHLTKELQQTLQMFPLEQLSVYGRQLPHINLDTGISSSITTGALTASLQSLSISRLSLTGDPVMNMASWLPRSNIVSLSLCRCDLALFEMTEIIQALPSSAMKLNLSGNNRTSQVYLTGRFSSLIRSNLQSLDMSWCSLDTCNIMAVIHSLPQTLTLLSLTGNCSPGSSEALAQELISKTEILSRLERLDLKRNNIPGQAVEKIKAALTSLGSRLHIEIEEQKNDLGAEMENGRENEVDTREAQAPSQKRRIRPKMSRAKLTTIVMWLLSLSF